MSETFFHYAVREDKETEIYVEIEVGSWGSPAQTYGPPESCHDGDPGEAWVKDAWLVADKNKPNAPRIKLTEIEEERIMDGFWGNEPETDYDPEFDV